MSSWKGIRLPAVAAIFSVVLALAMAGSRVYTQRLLVNPVQEQLAAIPGVERVQTEAGATWQIEVKLGSGVDLPRTYAQIRQVIDSRLGARAFRLRLQPDAHPQTVATYEQMQLWVQEAIATGRFADLPVALARVAREHGAGALGVWADGQAVYVRFQQGSDWFYAVEPRPAVAMGRADGPADRGGAPSANWPVTASDSRGGSDGTNA